VTQVSMRLRIALGLCLAFVSSLDAGFAATAAASSLYVVPGNSLQIPAGGTGYLQVRGVAMQPGGSVPTGVLTLAAQQPQAGDKTRTAVFYGIDWGYSDSAPDQVALAVWWTQDGNWRSSDHATAERIANAAANAQGIPSWNPDGRNLITAISQGQASVAELTLTAWQQTTSVGNGTLTVRNSSGSDMVVYLPYGTVFTGATGSVMVWVTGTGGGSVQGTPTTLPANPTNPPAATATATTAAATDTPVAAQPSPTPVTPKGGGQPPATPTAADTNTPLPNVQVKGSSPTATTAPATDTPVPPQPTDTPRPTDTPLPTNTPQPQPTNTQVAASHDSQQGAAQLPPSQPQQPVQHKGDTVQAPAPPTVSNPSTTKSEAQTDQPGPPAQAANPNQTVDAPLPFTAVPTHSGTPTVARPGSGGPGNGGPANGSAGQAAPPPVSTTLSQNSPPPAPVGTNAAKATVPFPVSTANATVGAPGEATKPAVIPPNPVATGEAAKPTIAPIDPGGLISPGGTSGDVKPTEQVPTPAPTPAPAPIEKQPDPVIVTGPPGTTDGAPSGAANPAPPSNTQGSPPNENPVTGGGPSSMPLWMAAAAMLMLLGGWALRRVGHNRPATVEAKTTED
jgi:hypothetical protein